VRAAAVTAREDGQTRLAAYVVSEPGKTLTAAELHDYLKQKLPESMVPAAFAFLAALPLTPNGKVDRKALPVPDFLPLETKFVAPRNQVEEMVLGIFRSVLGRVDFGVFDNFFDLGGHSLMAARLIAQLSTASGVDVPLRKLFAQPTVVGMAEAVEGLKWLQKSPPAPSHSAGLREEIVL
jgi:hypothetical protein